ncbi:hypothetical protein F511_16916 [Dorcoceras hygrometricum]|uniref:Uncharacterized protein n=1 Tax=Dorcoceras hygrometricum TaxID=472368 RepID=A0A2Z7AR21_9LAMI|nr:hypothetical protein F511_16916 [Dorcoceras hygrometricum]
MVNAGLWEKSAFERRASIHRMFLAKRQRLVKICFGRAMERSDRHRTGRMRRRMMGSDLLSEKSDLQQTSSFCIATTQIFTCWSKISRSAGTRRPAEELNNDDISSNVSNQLKATAQTSSWYWKLAIAKRCRLNKSIRQRFAFTLKESADDFRWTFSKANPAADDLATQNSAATQLQQLVLSDADFIFSTKILDAKQDSLYRKLHHGNSRRFLTRTRQISRSNRRIERTKKLPRYFEILNRKNSSFARQSSAEISAEFLAKVLCKRRTSSSPSTVRAPFVQIGSSHSNSARTDFFTIVIWVYGIFRISGLLCVTNGLDPLEE